MTDAIFSVDIQNRRIKGLVLPFGELSSPSVSGTDPIKFGKGTVTLPADPSIVTLNEGHDSLEVRGHATSLEETDAGIVAEFAVARTPEGDALLASASATPRPRLSAEVRGLVRRGADAVTAALRGAAVVPQGAFQSAALFAALGTVTDAPADELRELITDAVTDALAAPQTTEAAPVAPDTTEATEAEEEQKETTVADAVVPATLTAPGAPKKDETSPEGLFAAIVAARSGNAEAVRAYSGGDALFAISPIQHSGPSTVTIGVDVQQPAYLGELWKRRPYDRRFVPLVNHGTLTNYQVIGWQWDDGKEPVVGDYTGNTAEIPSNALDTKQVTATAARIAGGHKIDRRYLDFNDQGVIASYFSHMVEDVARKTDAKALAAIVGSATTSTAGTVPSGIATGLAAIVDGALDVIETENRPSFAIVDPALWRDIMLTGKDDTFAYLNAAFGLEEGGLEGFKIIPGGTKGSGLVYVGAKEALTFYELGGTAPIRVEGIDPHHGAIDPAVFAYWAAIVNNAAAIRVVDTDPA